MVAPIQLLSEILPKLSRVGLMVDRTYPSFKAIEENAARAARAAGTALVPYYLGNPARRPRDRL
jgi:hypothetical protein